MNEKIARKNDEKRPPVEVVFSAFAIVYFSFLLDLGHANQRMSI